LRWKNFDLGIYPNTSEYEDSRVMNDSLAFEIWKQVESLNVWKVGCLFMSEHWRNQFEETLEEDSNDAESLRT